MLAKQSLFINTSSDVPALGELDDVTVLHAVMSEIGELVPKGARGTIVMVHGSGEAYTVEFAEPVHALVMLEAGSVQPIPGATREHLAALAT